MKKFLNDITADETVTTSTVVVLDTTSLGLIARFFVAREPMPGQQVISSWSDVPRPVANGGLDAVKESIHVLGAALSDDLNIQESVFCETHRQFFSPSEDLLSLGSAEMDDYTCIVLPVNAQTLAPGFPYAHFTQAAASKASVRRQARIRGEYAHLVLAAMKADAPLEEWVLVRTTIPGLLFVDKTTGSWMPLAVGESVFSFLPTITLSCPATVDAAGSCVVEVTVEQNGAPLDYEGDLRVEMLSGYANKTRVPVLGGHGSFKVLPLGLDSGEDIRFKLGTKNVTGLASASIKVA